MEDRGAPDTAAQGQPVEQQEMFDIVDTPGAAPDASGEQPAQSASQAAPEQLIFGKFRSIEEAQKAYSEAERRMHEATQRNAEYEREFAERHRATPPAQAPFDPSAFEEQFKERLAENPAETLAGFINFIVQKNREQDMAREQARISRFQHFASNPEYADVLPEVAQALPFATQPLDPVEATFLRAQNARLRQMLATQQGQRPLPFVESASGSRRESGKMTLELEDADKVRMRFRDEDQLRSLGRMVGKIKAEGGTLRGMNIDDYERANR